MRVEIETLRTLLRPDPETGRLYWLEAGSGRPPVGGEAGGVQLDGYRTVMIGRKHYPAHHLAFALHHGRWPEQFLDHENRDRADNRPANLREASHSQNQHNRGKQKRNTSGYKGVSWCKRTGKWHAQIAVSRKAINLGYFSEAEEAGRAYERAAMTHHGEFARSS